MGRRPQMWNSRTGRAGLTLPEGGPFRNGLPAAERGALGLPAAERGALGLPAAERGAFGLPAAERGAFGLPAAERGAFGLPAAERGAFGLPAAERGVLNLPVAEPECECFTGVFELLLLFVGFIGGAFRLSSSIRSSYRDFFLRWRQMSVASPFALC